MESLLAVVALAALGSVSGVPGRDASIEVFKGIPFAAPPVGELRWRAPQPAAPWTGVKKADHFGNSCIQREVTESKPWTYEFMNHVAISEDCLYLNVWTPARSPAAKLPVFVYIYGGAFNEGSGAVPAYDGEGLAHKGLVVVTFNYRVGTLGFLAHPELTAESPHNTSGNYGLLDQIAALEWVRKNIGGFGGDPAQVTIAGQSAGGSSVHALIASPLAKGLFARAIVESGSRPSNLPVLKRAEEIGVEFAKSKGAASIAELRAMSADKLTGRGARLILDGWVLPEVMSMQSDVPMLTGTNKHEGGATPHPAITAEAFRASALQRFGKEAGEFLALYPTEASQNDASWDQARVSTYVSAHKRGGTAKTYIYFWDHAIPGPDSGLYGAFHTSEVPYVLNTLYMSDRPFTAADRKIADQVSSYWANFAKTGNPNGKGLPAWPAVGEKAETMEIGDSSGPIAVAGSDVKFKFWASR